MDELDKSLDIQNYVALRFLEILGIDSPTENQIEFTENVVKEL